MSINSPTVSSRFYFDRFSRILSQVELKRRTTTGNRATVAKEMSDKKSLIEARWSRHEHPPLA